jgi:hypothetical protein
MRPGPATPAASSVDLPTRLVRHSRGGMMLLARQRSRGSAAFAKAGCTRDLATTMRNRCGGRQPIPTHERDRGGGRNARATSSRSHAFPICPPAIHPRESPAAAGPAAIIRQAQKTLTFSLHPLSVRTPRPATKKQPTLVRKLWTKSLPCGNPRKTETIDEIAPTKPIKRKPGAPYLAAFARSGDFPCTITTKAAPPFAIFEGWDTTGTEDAVPLHLIASADRHRHAPASA